jgi:hypothetical protein
MPGYNGYYVLYGPVKEFIVAVETIVTTGIGPWPHWSLQGALGYSGNLGAQPHSRAPRCNLGADTT